MPLSRARAGSLFAVGDNTGQQLGMDLGADKHASHPVLVRFKVPTPIKQVACGAVHTLALAQDGRVSSAKVAYCDSDCRVLSIGVFVGHWSERRARPQSGRESRNADTD